MVGKFKTLKDVDLVLAFQNGNVLMPMRNLIGEAALSMFVDMHLLHLININSKRKVVPFNILFKRFLSDQLNISIRKIEYVMKRLVDDGLVLKNGREYKLSEEFSVLFERNKKPLNELPWADRPNYK